MSAPAPHPIDYASPPPSRLSPWTWPRWLPIALVLVQCFWFALAGMLMLVLDIDPPSPLRDFFIVLATLFPSLAAIAIGISLCRNEYRRNNSIRRLGFAVFAILLAAGFVAAGAGWWIYVELFQ